MVKKHFSWIVTLAILVAVVVIVLDPGQSSAPTTEISTETQIEEITNIKYMKITSSAFDSGASIPSKYTCDAEDINPPIEINEIPQGTRSLALIVDDPDANKVVGHTWDHWVVYNIPPETKKITENSIPNDSVQGNTSFGKPGYGGPCPPAGDPHTYYFKAYALDVLIDSAEPLDKKTLEEKMEGHIIASAELTGTYQRQP
jgi:Raf kinase inhibitor-like YbhB/YbcL family protein